MGGRPVIRVLSVASECAPLVKTGGLADVVGALPRALAAEGIEMRVLLPGYPQVMRALGEAKVVHRERELYGGPARLLAAEAAELDLLILDAPHLYAREGSIYLGPGGADWPDNPERFAGLSWIAARIGAGAVRHWRPDVIHAHDWQAGLVPDHVAQMDAPHPATLLTIHNMAFHGLAPAEAMTRLRIPPARFDIEGVEFWGKISMLKAGLTRADRLTTVSPSYAAELMTPEFGAGLDGVMRQRRDVLSGILNGIDGSVWNPATDPAIKRYRSLRGKEGARRALREELALPEAEGPICVVVSRLSEQKGLDLLLEALPALLQSGGQLALLGSGDPRLETAWRAAAARHPGVAVRIGYDEALSHRMIAGGDAILVPSRFEPCGLTQLYGLAYGTVPVVALTGGLADTVVNASPAGLASGAATGIQFHPVSAEALRGALVHLCDLFSQKEVWTRIQRNAMKHPVGWDASARAYAALYAAMTGAE